MLRTTPTNRKQSRNQRIAGYGLKTVLAGLLVGGTMATVSCDAPASKEDLNPEGPPMIRQVMINEANTTASGAVQKQADQLAFGDHASDLFRDDDRVVATATIQGTQEIRIVLDEQIRGNSLEEISCADGSFSRIPDGTTPDDIDDCSGAVDSLQNCKIDLCLGADGKPVGVELVEIQGGGADRFVLRMIDYNPDPNIVELGVQVICGGSPVPMDQTLSYWSPSGNQTISSNPALAKKSLGPVVVLKTLSGTGMPANLDCTVQFHPDVVDHDGNQVCASTGGLVANDCTPGDTSKISFGTQAITIDDLFIADGATNVGLGESSLFAAFFNANMDGTTAGAVTLTAGGTPVTMMTEVQDDDKTGLLLSLPADFEPETEYVLTIGTGFHDQFGRGLTQDVVVTWTTAAAPIVVPLDATVTDAGLPDA
ncbi:MAG: Ig-like domain-containing protein [Kofleriaceae bacterium]|nr:Ig-like domain-containing protein [Kofleriaceae bacterium]